ncbi:hypothetical protein NW761_008225 [Fusarium oxysporum]|nr:hypothetical protein NW758_006772 [Fusarium oxysporum]KAJ4086605.1 hypothetical protein NW761_008225 [Fusarium oxysporum]KAJ4103866.1 hypothetical protein NW769_009557 [Fusarium oxysporum]KAJ4214860.1 hypothetical protein NW760_014583 [Fusarium oxysporum]
MYSGIRALDGVITRCCVYSIRFRLSSCFYFGAETDTLLVVIYIVGKPVEDSLVFHDPLRGKDHIEHISDRHREYAHGLTSTYTFSSQDLKPAECTTAVTLQTDMQLVETLITIRVVLRLAKNMEYYPMHDSSDEWENISSLQPSKKALVLNGHGQTHGTSQGPHHFGYFDVDVGETIEFFDLMYLWPNTLGAQSIKNPAFINQAAQGMPQTFEPAPEPPRSVRTMSNACLEIELTGDDG